MARDLAVTPMGYRATHHSHVVQTQTLLLLLGLGKDTPPLCDPCDPMRAVPALVKVSEKVRALT